MPVAEDASLAIIIRARDEASGVLNDVGNHMSGLGQFALIGAAVAGAALVGIGVHALGMAADFQQATTRLVTEAGESADHIDMIRQSLLRLAPEVGKSPKELADGMYFIESAGFHGAAGIEVLRASAIAARVGMSAFTPVADAVTSALNAYSMPAGNAVRVTDILTKTVAEGKLQMEDLAGSIGKVLPVAATAGISLQDVGAAIATMTAQGTNAAQATTALRFMISNLEGPTKQASGALKEVGLTAQDVFAALHDPSRGLHGALEMIVDHINTRFKPGSQEATQALKDIAGGTRGLTAALELTGPHMGTYTANLHGMTEATSGAGLTMRGWHEVQQNFNVVLDQFKAGLASASIELGDHLLPVATQVLRWAISMRPVVDGIVIGFVDFIETLGRLGLIQPIIAGLASIMAILVVHMLAMKVAGLIEFIVGLGSSFLATAAEEGVFAAVTAVAGGPITLLVLGIAALIAILVLVVTHWQQIVAVAQQVGTALRNDLGAALQWLGTAFQGFLAWLGANWPLVLGILLAPFTGGLSILVALVLTHMTQIRQFIGSALTGIENALGAAWQAVIRGVTTAWSEIVSTIVGIVTGFLSWLGQELPQIPYQIGYALGLAIGTAIKFGIDLVSWATTAIPNFIATISGFLASLPGMVANWLLNAYQRFVAFGLEAIAWASAAIPNLINTISNFLASLPGTIWNWLVSAYQRLQQFETEAISWAISTGTSIVNNLINFIASLPGRVAGLLASVVGNLISFGGQMASQGSNAGNQFVNTLINVVRALPGEMVSIGVQIVQGIWNGIQSMAGWLTNQAQSMASGLVNGIKKGLGIGSPSLVAALEVGAPIVQGVVQGINDNAGQVTTAVRNALPNASAPGGPLQAGVAIGGRMALPVGVAAGPELGPGGGRDVVFDLQVDGTVLARIMLKEAEVYRRLRGGRLGSNAG